MKEQIKTPEKELNKIETSNLSDAEINTLIIRMLKKLSEDLSSIKKIQSETKDILIEIMKNLQGNNSRVDEAENHINDLEHKEAKNKAIRTTGRKKNFKKGGQCKQPLGQLQEVQRSHHRGARRGEKEQEIGNLFEKIMKENVPNLAKEIDMQVQEAQTVPNKMDANKAHSKTYHN